MTIVATEARLHRAISHPNVVKVFEAGVVDGEPYLAMEWLEGMDLEERMQKAPLTIRESLALVRRAPPHAPRTPTHATVRTARTPRSTRAARAASRPYTPGLGLCVWTMSGFSSRKSLVSSTSAAASLRNDIDRVALSSAMWRTPRASIAGTYSPGALTPMTS